MKKTNNNPSWLPDAAEIPCPSWCRNPHVHEVHLSDREHYNQVLHIEPALMAPMGEVDLTVAIHQQCREIGPRITITPDLKEHGPGMTFTAAEAETIAKALLKAVKLVRKG